MHWNTVTWARASKMIMPLHHFLFSSLLLNFQCYVPYVLHSDCDVMVWTGQTSWCAWIPHNASCVGKFLLAQSWCTCVLSAIFVCCTQGGGGGRYNRFEPRPEHRDINWATTASFQPSTNSSRISHSTTITGTRNNENNIIRLIGHIGYAWEYGARPNVDAKALTF
jgi:hypothetical protein